PASAATILIARPLPEWNPLAAVIISHALRDGHDCEHTRPDKYVRKVAAPPGKRAANQRRIKTPQRPSGYAVDRLDQQVEERHLHELVVERGKTGGAKHRIQC